MKALITKVLLFASLFFVSGLAQAQYGGYWHTREARAAIKAKNDYNYWKATNSYSRYYPRSYTNYRRNQYGSYWYKYKGSYRDYYNYKRGVRR